MRHPALVLAAAAVLLLSPTLALGTLISHSSPQNLTWASQFAEQVRAGILYPRWMPESFDGLGSPAFYFYPPLPFWIDALVSVVTANALPVSYRLAASTTVILFLSGLAMHVWLLRVSGKPTAALVGAIAYMAAPYHLFDTFTRGAFAETTAYAVLPVVMLALRRTLEGTRWGLPLLALAYAALLLSHLPTALLCSITVLPAYGLFATRSPALLLRCAAGGALGVGLAAIYLLPAIELQPWISAHELWTSFYRASNWFVMAPERWVDPDTMRVIGSIVLAAALLAAGLCLAVLQLPDGQGRRELGFWVALGLACLILIAGLLPWFWDLPLVGKVQFPWRLLMVVEFASLTALCLAPLARAPPRRRLCPCRRLRRPGAGRGPDRDRCAGTLRLRVADRHARPARRQGIPARRLQVRRLALCRPRPGAAQGHAGDRLHAGCRDVQGRQRAVWRDARHGRQRGADQRGVAALLLPGLAARHRPSAGSLRAAAAGLVHRPGRPHRGAAGSRGPAHRAMGLGDFGCVPAAAGGVGGQGTQ